MVLQYPLAEEMLPLFAALLAVGSERDIVVPIDSTRSACHSVLNE